MDDEVTLRTAALNYAAQSWRVFPCVAGSKAPLVRGGFKSATTDYRTIDEWWQAWPNANIGFAIPEGTLVLDFDPRNGAPRPDALGLPATRYATTPGGGLHLYYTVPEDLEFRGRFKDALGVDVKAPGKGYVLLPPSKVGEDYYEWAGSANVAMTPLPASVLEDVTRPRHPVDTWDTPGTEGRHYAAWEHGSRYGMAVLRNAVGMLKDAKNGERNNALFRAACGVSSFIAGGELDEDYALNAMLDAAQDAGLAPEEAYRTIRSAYDRASRQPRRRPERG